MLHCCCWYWQSELLPPSHVIVHSKYAAIFPYNRHCPEMTVPSLHPEMTILKNHCPAAVAYLKNPSPSIMMMMVVAAASHEHEMVHTK